MAKFYRVKINLPQLKYYLNEKSNELFFEAYDRQELILIAYAILSEYRKLKFKKILDTSDN